MHFDLVTSGLRESRQFKDFEDYLLPLDRFVALQLKQALPLAVDSNVERFLGKRLEFLERELQLVNRLALSDELPDAVITEKGMRITPLDNAVPEEADALMQTNLCLVTTPQDY